MRFLGPFSLRLLITREVSFPCLVLHSCRLINQGGAERTSLDCACYMYIGVSSISRHLSFSIEHLLAATAIETA